MNDFKAFHTRTKQLYADLRGLPYVSIELQDRAAVADELDRAVKDPDLYKAVAKLFRDGHHARAVEEAFKLLNNLVKKRIQSSDDGSKLMKNAFTVNNPELKLNPNVTES